MSDRITITGLVATQPRHIVTSEGLPITSFRLASRSGGSIPRPLNGSTETRIGTP